MRKGRTSGAVVAHMCPIYAVLASNPIFDELPRPLDDCSALGRPRHRDATPAPEFEQSLVAEQPQRAKNGVRVDAEDGSEILGWRQALSRLRLALGDRPPNLGGDLLEEVGRVGFVHLDTNHGPSNTSPIGLRRKL